MIHFELKESQLRHLKKLHLKGKLKSSPNSDTYILCLIMYFIIYNYILILHILQ